MSYEQKDQLSRWLPALVALFTLVANVLYVGYQVGIFKQRLESNELNAQKESSVFRQDILQFRNEYVTRLEYNSNQINLSAQVTDLKQGLKDINSKLDRIIESRALDKYVADRSALDAKR